MDSDSRWNWWRDSGGVGRGRDSKVDAAERSSPLATHCDGRRSSGIGACDLSANNLIFGLVPAAMAAKVDVESALRDWGKSVSGSTRARRRIGILVAAEVTLATVLLFGGGLFISSYFRLQRTQLGFSPHGVLSMRVLPGARQQGNLPALRAFHWQAVEKVAGVPGVHEVAVSNGLPLDFPSNVSLSKLDHRIRLKAKSIPLGSHRFTHVFPGDGHDPAPRAVVHRAGFRNSPRSPL